VIRLTWLRNARNVEKATEASAMENRIGEAAGKIWATLNAKGPLGKAELGKAVGLPAELVNQGIGWLAREGKISVQEQGRKQLLTLR
jgi:hypothetical protein